MTCYQCEKDEVESIEDNGLYHCRLCHGVVAVNADTYNLCIDLFKKCAGEKVDDVIQITKPNRIAV